MGSKMPDRVVCQGAQGSGLVVFDVRAPASLVLERRLAI